MKSLLSILAATLLLSATTASGQDVFDAETSQFLHAASAQADLPVQAVQHGGRTSILDTLARRRLEQFYGSAAIGAPPAAAYLELYLNTGQYVQRPLINVRGKALRSAIQRRLQGPAAEAFARSHRLPAALLMDEDAWRLLVDRGRAQEAQRPPQLGQLRDALADLGERPELRVSVERLAGAYSAFLAEEGLPIIPARPQWLSPHELGAQDAPLRADWAALERAWRGRDLPELMSASQKLASDQAAVAEAPRAMRLLELYYNRAYKGTPLFAGFAAATVLLVIGVSTGRRRAARAGLAVMAVCTAALFAGFVVRWALSGRAWYAPPIMNQFESLVASALLGAAAAIILELVRPQGYFALAASLYAAAALLAGLLLPQQTGADISMPHGILDSPVMALHVAVIIIGHALAGMAGIISVIYIKVLAAGRVRRGTGPDSTASRGAASLEAIDRCNLITAQLAAWTIALGTAIGAYWGDFAWGRWWGWDPKETWALITVLILVAMLHLRFACRPCRRGLLTALLCLLAAAAMLFNWIVVNYFLAGMHSYA